MKIYVCHSTNFDFRNELYLPLRNSELNTKHTFIFPHETSSTPYPSKEIIPTCDLIIAEVSYPSTGMGIELGWANYMNKKVVYIFRKGTKISSSLCSVSTLFHKYNTPEEMIQKLTKTLVQ